MAVITNKVMFRSFLVSLVVLLSISSSSGFISNVRYSPMKAIQPMVPLSSNVLKLSSSSCSSPSLSSFQQYSIPKQRNTLNRLHSINNPTFADEIIDRENVGGRVMKNHNEKKRDVMSVSPMVKIIMLSTLVLQNAGTSLLSVYVRKQTQYDGAAVSLVQEVGKIPVILGMFAVLKSRGHTNETYQNVWKETFSLSAFELALPALCFAGQNVLYFTALSHIDAATYSILSQSKTAFTAFFFVTLLGRTLNAAQVSALTLLTVGMGLVQSGPKSSSVAIAAISTGRMVGIAAALASSLFSGLATILFEKQAKRKDGSLCAKQIQLVSWTSVFTAMEIVRRSGFRGLLPKALVGSWTSAVWSIVLLKTAGGMLTATSIRLTDNMVKTFATAAAIIITAVASPPSIMMRGSSFITGVTMVMTSAFLYAKASR